MIEGNIFSEFDKPILMVLVNYSWTASNSHDKSRGHRLKWGNDAWFEILLEHLYICSLFIIIGPILTI